MTAVSRKLLDTALLLAAISHGTVLLAQPFRPKQVPEISLAVQFDEADNVARSHLERVDRFLEAGGWDEAVETLRRVMDTSGERMMRLEVDSPGAASGFERYLTLRDFCQMKLVTLPPTAAEALGLYRSRVDPLAERLYQRAVDDRDETLFRRIVAQYFASSWGDDALMKLGEFELGRGNYTLARAAWERISPALRMPASEPGDFGAPRGHPLWLALRGLDLDNVWERLEPLFSNAPQQPDWLVFPDTDIDLADVRARLALVSILEGSATRAELELVVLKRLHPDAEGTIGGRQGRYVDLLTNLLEESQSWPAARGPDGWKTFGGAPTRAKIADDGVDIALRPIWMVPLPVRRAVNQEDDPDAGKRRTGESPEGLLSYHPIVADDRVLVCTGEDIHDIQAFDLQSGRPLWPHDPDAMQRDAAENVWLRLLEGQRQYGVPRYTMTAYQGRLFAKLGPYATTIPRSVRHDPVLPGHLAALDLTAQKKRLFEIRLTPDDWSPGWAFEGPPLVAGSDIYVSMRRRDNMRAQIHVACFRMKANRAELRWRRFIASAETIGQGQAVEYTHNLLTLDQDVLYVNTNLGAVAAVDASDGEVRWITRYPRVATYDKESGRPNLHAYCDLNPCMVRKDLMVVAPQDCDQIFALDAATGMVIWSTGPQRAVDAVHLLGIAGGHVIASGHRLYWIDAYTGRIAGSFPERVQDDLRGYGRGIVAGDKVYWPTRSEIYVFDVRTMRLVRQPINLAAIGMAGGNLLVADGVMLVAGADKLAAFNTYGRQAPTAEDTIPASDLDSGD